MNEKTHIIPTTPVGLYSNGHERGAVQVTLIVLAVVLACVLIFLHGSTKWLTFWTFVVGLAPFVVAAYRRDQHVRPAVRHCEPDLTVNGGTDDDNFGYIPGVRNFDGSYLD